ncbi:triple gene block 3 protein [Phlox virus B]|uniref:Movement protein TGBp3 n=1 Tax=Phlox virus B TaxID=475777 RepID=A8II63_9VIRU|nr:triple gene block 3 protein [Phlox virus B]ABW05095.1 triple gene block 3 protein [Phlox virus B]
MFSTSQLIVILIGLLFVLAYGLIGTSNNCVVLITGESVRIINCKFTGEFVEYAKTLKPAGSC